MRSLTGIALLLFGSLHLMLLLCTQEAIGSHCVPYQGSVGFLIEGEAPCTAQKIDEETYHLKSPNYPNDYPNKIKCDAKISTAGPRYLVIHPMAIDVQEKDRITLIKPFKHKQWLTSADLGMDIYSPSSGTDIKFRSSVKNSGKGFDLKITAKKNDCQHICNLQAGQEGHLHQLNYKPHTFCEWWLTAPTGCKIILEFDSFDVGTVGGSGSGKCQGDYLGVSRLGDKLYKKNKLRSMCGSSLPKRVKSDGNKLNILFNGKDGGNGFKLNYRVECPGLTTTPPPSTTGTSTSTSTTTTTTPTTTTTTTPTTTTTTTPTTTTTTQTTTTTTPTTPPTG
ncbi:cubilin [Hyalella azteca]|uniref:Cubilin n=1 Tax=Hyalella azteca TaxID=294128 RepID=A0A8B7N5V3_HYAAZ|nr:cubilin [Hyalella azteca]